MKHLKEKIALILLASLVLSLFGLIFRVEKSLKTRLPEVFVGEPYRPANIVVNVDRNYGTIRPVWRALAQGGEEGGGVRMLEPAVEPLKRIEPAYIRLDHIYDDDYYGVVKGRNPDGSLKLDWSSLDQTVEDILDSGAKPFFSLSYMPSALADSKIDQPKNWADWQTLVRQTVEHYSSEIDGVYYEVWNEPSLNWFGGWKMYGVKDYRRLYRQSVLGANQAQGVKDFKIGGPAIPELDPAWIRLLLGYCSTQNLRLDFISWHRYSFYPQVFLNDVYQINVLTSQPAYRQYQDLEKVITEWGPNPEKDTVYSSQVAAAHAVEVIRKMLDKVTWLFAFEVKDGPDQGEAGWGLLTHQTAGLKEKPRYLLYDWLAQVEGNRVEVLGEGSQVSGFASFDNKTVTLILANYAVSQAKDEAFPVVFQGIKPGRYRLFKQTLFKKPQENQLKVEEDSYKLDLTMPAYSVVRLRLTRIGS